MDRKGKGRLNSWKEIAAYLGCEERTARRWESERRLPVYRAPGGKRSAVHAFADELDPWLRNHGNSRPAAEPAASATRRVSRRAGLAALGGAALASGGALAWLFRRPAGNPARATVAGKTLQAWDEKGRLIWEHTFQEPLSQRDPGPGSLGSLQQRVRVADLRGDGSNQVLLAAAFPVQDAEGPEREELFCFSPEGRLLWRYKPDVALTFGETRFDGPWRFTDLLVTPGNPRKTICLAVVHWNYRPSFILRINPDGAATLHYVQAGHVYCLRYIRNAAGSFIVAGGINNEYACAALAVLREDGPPGRSPQTAGTRFECLDAPKGSPDRYFLFPPSEINRLEWPYNRVEHLRVVERRPFIGTYENESASAIYRFSEALEPESVAFSDGYAHHHRRFEKDGRLKHRLEDCPQLRRPVPVRRWDPNSGWTTVQVPPAQGIRPDGWRS